MKKILIEIASPAAGLTYDMFVPDTLQIGELARLACEVFRRMSNGLYSGSAPPILCNAEDGSSLESSGTVRSSRIRNGTRLILF